MGTKRKLLFVYGSLRRGEMYEHYLNEAEPVAMQAWTSGMLFDTGEGYPAMSLLGSGRVYGEVYRITEKELAAIDQLEDFQPGGHGNLYERVRLPIETDQASLEALAYIFPQPRTQEMPVVEMGDWKSRRLTKEEEFLYFAYGSCMDDERFRLQGVAGFFRDMVGCGVLKGYAMCYTLPYADGGRADIVEHYGSTVEGKVYRIGKEGLEYLLWREGVHRGVYRPAWVTLQLGGKLVSNVLTFTVMDKKQETAPPDHYAREILRGGKGIVSDRYYQQLQRDLKEKFGMDVKG
ncbi:gamma-glutamylcyclotransferase [Salinithrix halophila]|uniref:Gamma-glutamylcyclotransferase n=1 Tax=Salinithrix halophila TaxID=1485204 RepID=A0ABV8JEV5_9BACL